MKKGAASRQVTKKRRVDHLIIKMAIDTMYGIYVYFWLNEHQKLTHLLVSTPTKTSWADEYEDEEGKKLDEYDLLARLLF